MYFSVPNQWRYKTSGWQYDDKRISGRVETYIDGKWLRILPAFFDGFGHAVCWQLGYSDHLHVGNVTDFK